MPVERSGIFVDAGVVVFAAFESDEAATERAKVARQFRRLVRRRKLIGCGRTNLKTSECANPINFGPSGRGDFDLKARNPRRVWSNG